MKLKKFLTKKGYHSIQLQTIPSGHHIIYAKLNKKKGTFILDTGASNTCVDASQTQYFKMKTKETEHKATGAGSDEIDIDLSKKNTIKIGDWKMKKMQIVVMDLGHINEALSMFGIQIDGIVGSDVLHEGKGIIQYEKELLFLK